MIPIARPVLGEEEQEAVRQVLASGQLAHGPVTAAFERDFARLAGARHAVAVSNGTVALHLALLAAGVGPGDEVVTSPFSFVATANAIRMAGAVPVFADIDPATFNLDAGEARRACTPRTKAILPVHLFGLPSDVAALRELADGLGVALVEDAAQAHGAAAGGRPVGSWGDLACFSLYPTKNMTTGEGGVVTTDDDAAAALLRSLRNHGRGDATLGTYDHVRLGYNYRTTDLASAIGRVQLGRLPGLNAARQANAAALAAGLEGVPGLRLPACPAGRTHVYHQFTVRHPDRSGLAERLRSRGVGSGVYYPRVLYEYGHLLPFARRCPAAEEAAREVLSLPVHPLLEKADLDHIVASVRG